jgi:adenosylhomocysteine/aminodeoxyfutalosine nucleosidase
MKKIAILGAMELEIQPILEKLGNYETVAYANNKYYLATYNDKELIIAHSKIGKVFSAMTATIMIEHFGADTLIFTGVAGGLKDLQVGDIMAATATVQHDFDITAFGYAMGHVPSSEVKINTSESLLDSVQKVALDMGIDLKYGVIATGDQFIHNVDKKDFIVNEFDAMALEMEGASVNLVCNEIGIPSLILRSISDTADGAATDNFDEFAIMAAKRSARLVLGLLGEI